MCSHLCSEVNGRLEEIQRDFTRHFKRTPPVISKGLHSSFPYGKCHPPQRGGLAGSLFEGAVSRRLTEGVTLFEGDVGAS